MMQSVVNHVPDKSLETFLKSKDKHEQNVLHHLLSNTVDVNISVVNYVLKWPVGINDVNDAGMSPMAKYFRAFVLYGGDDAPEVLHLMFKCGANPAFETEEGLGLAHLAAGSRRVSVRLLRTLTSWGVDLKAEDKQGRTALHHSAIKGILTEDVLGFLCNEFGLSTELQDAHGKTPLDYAVELGQSHRHPDFFDSNRWARTEGLLRGLERKT
jgi:ankyrin repeat protein